MADENIEKQVLNDVHEDSHAPEIEAEVSNPPEIQVEDSHPPEIQAEGSHPPGIQSGDSHPPEIQAGDSRPSEIQAEDSHPLKFQGHEIDSKDESAVNSLVNHNEKKWPGWPGENVFRMLVPAHKVGSIIGRKGEYIKKTCEETKARIKILDGPPGTTERAVMISAKEEPDAAIPPAMDGLLKVHKRIVDVDTDPSHAASAAGGTVSTRMLVAAAQAGSLIGKQGATVKSIQDSSSCIIKVLGGENLPVFALPDDSVVEVQGESSGVHKAVELIASHLRKFLVDRSVIGIFEMQMQNVNGRGNQDVPLPQSWGPPPQGFPMNGGGGPGFVSNQQYRPPARQFENYYPPSDMPPMDKQSRQGPPARQFDNYYPQMDKQSRQGPPAYGRDLSIGTHTPSMQPQKSMVTKVSQNMQVPLEYADAVIGNSGTNISYIRRTSGASIAVQEGVPGEMTVEIKGSASEVQTAVQLIQNFVAAAASAAQNPPGAPPPGQGYDPYSNGGPAYSVYGNYGH